MVFGHNRFINTFIVLTYVPIAYLILEHVRPTKFKGRDHRSPRSEGRDHRSPEARKSVERL